MHYVTHKKSAKSSDQGVLQTPHSLHSALVNDHIGVPRSVSRVAQYLPSMIISLTAEQKMMSVPWKFRGGNPIIGSGGHRLIGGLEGVWIGLWQGSGHGVVVLEHVPAQHQQQLQTQKTCKQQCTV